MTMFRRYNSGPRNRELHQLTRFRRSHAMIQRSLRWMALALVAVMLLPGWAVSQDSAKQLTFTKDIAPIFQEKCQACHRDGSIAPMSLVTYEETRPWAKSIKA